MEGAEPKAVTMLFYTPYSTPRIQYMVHYFNECLGVNAVVTDDLELYRSHRTEKINYSAARIHDEEFWICPAGLLQESELRNQDIHCFDWHGLPAFFPTDDDLGFDVLAATFFLLTRYEEYLEYEPDAYGRFAHWNSLAWKQGFLNRPLVDEWMQEFRKILQTKFPMLRFTAPAFQLLPTYDIDIAWSYLHKGFFRSLGGVLRQPKDVINRVRVLLRRQPDPYDAVRHIAQMHEAYGFQALTFFLAARQRSELDKNVSPFSKAFRSLVLHYAGFSEIGLHPSDFSNTHPECLLKEKQLLEDCLHQSVTKSRHHYLKIHVPHSYRFLLHACISDDYSMGYGTVNGFRASTSRSFLWYDLEGETETLLRVHPLAWMEANSFYELKHSPQEALNELMHLYQQTKKAGGTLITVMHNHFLGTDPLYAGWGTMYEQFLSHAAADQ